MAKLHVIKPPTKPAKIEVGQRWSCSSRSSEWTVVSVESRRGWGGLKTEVTIRNGDGSQWSLWQSDFRSSVWTYLGDGKGAALQEGECV